MTDIVADAPQTLADIPREPTQDGPAIRLYLVDGSSYLFRAYHALPRKHCRVGQAALDVGLPQALVERDAGRVALDQFTHGLGEQG